MKPAKLYIHVPFCHAKCAYCDFYSTPQAKWMDGYVDAVINEWNYRRKSAPDGIDTIYLGGGTPSSLPTALLRKLIDALPTDNALKEFTIEVNPEDVTDDWVRLIANDTTIDRVSMGIQSFSDEELNLITRRHNAMEAENAYLRLRSGGITNISCDLIYGLPGQSLDSWKMTLDRLIKLRPEHISAYNLSYEEGTRLHAMLSTGKITETDEDTIFAMYHYLCDTLRAAGYLHYEISNFSLPGKQAVHNSAYWDGSPYIGLGPGAHSWDGTARSYNPSNLKAYIAANGIGLGVTEEETFDNRFNDVLMTALRTAKGLNLSTLTDKFGDAAVKEMLKEVPLLIEKGYLQYTSPDNLIITEKHWLISNSILLPLIRV